MASKYVTAYTNRYDKDFQYTTLVGLGSAALKQDEGLAEVQVNYSALHIWSSVSCYE